MRCGAGRLDALRKRREADIDLAMHASEADKAALREQVRAHVSPEQMHTSAADGPSGPQRVNKQTHKQTKRRPRAHTDARPRRQRRDCGWSVQHACAAVRYSVRRARRATQPLSLRPPHAPVCLVILVCAQLAAAHDDACGVRAELKASREQRVKEGQELQARMAETRRELSQAPTLVQRP